MEERKKEKENKRKEEDGGEKMEKYKCFMSHKEGYENLETEISCHF